jgi:hypothetical protein
LVTVVLFFGAYLWNTVIVSKKVPAVAQTQKVSTSTQQTAPKYKHTRIADIKVGERVVVSTDDKPKSTAVYSATWKKVTLYAEETWYDGTVDSINVVTLVPPEWIALHDAKVGNLVPIPLDLQEMGLDEDLLAKVQTIEQCPEIRAGPGRVVLTTVNHLSRGICKLTYTTQDGKSETIRPTSSHKFYSLDRNEWIHIGDARFGEKLQGLGNNVITVISCQPLGTTERVYNMTVEDEHVYHVGKLNLLAHNKNCLALGVGENLGVFADERNAVTFQHWGRNMPREERTKYFMENFDNIMSNEVGIIHVNLTGRNGTRLNAVEMANDGAINGLNLDNPHIYTNYEFFRIRENPSWWDRIHFWYNGQEVQNPFQ